MTINNKTKTTSIIAITFFVALMMVPTGMNAFAVTYPDLTTMVQVDAVNDVHVTAPRGITMNLDGTKMFIIDNGGVSEYILSTAFDISTRVWIDTTSFVAQASSISDVEFNNDGTKLYIVDAGDQGIDEYTCGTAFDVSTCTTHNDFTSTSSDDRPQDLEFNADGTRVYIIGSTNNKIWEYTLTAFDFSTLSSSVADYSVVSQITNNPSALLINDAGTKVWVCGEDGVNSIFEYTMSTPWDLTTISITAVSPIQNSSHCMGMAVNDSGTKLITIDDISTDIYEYDLDLSEPPTPDLQDQIDALNNTVTAQSVLIQQLQNQIATLTATDSQQNTRLTALESSIFPVYYMVYGTEKIIPASSNSQFATVSCNAGDTAISGSYNIQGLIIGADGIRITNSVPTANGEGWYLRMDNVSSAEAEFTPAVLCAQYLS